jgi:hypothetical protein
MTQIVENWSRLSGRVESWDPPKSPRDDCILTVRVEQVASVATDRGDAYPNLLEAVKGRTVRIRVPAAAVPRVRARPGEGVTLVVRRGRSLDLLFAHPDLKE